MVIRVVAMIMTIVTIVICGSAGVARADNAKLAEARAEIDLVHYPDAQRLLGEALDLGGSTPAEVKDIYRLSASTAAALGHADTAEQFYRRWLALDPHASLAAGDSPKLQLPFAAARAYIQAHGGLVVRVDRGTGPADIDVTVVADPLAMAVAVVRGTEPAVPFAADRHARLAEGPGAIAITDDRGNHLVELDVPAAPITAPPPPAPTPPDEPTGWKIWATGAGVFTAVGVGFGIAAIAYASQIQDSVEHSGDHFVSDVYQDRDRSRQFAYISGGALAVGIGLAIPAVHFYPKSLRVLVTGSGVAVAGAF